MKKIIPLKKQINFKTNISEITSISLENTLYNNQYLVEGDLIISGTYKITETSQKVDEFEHKIPVTIEIDDKYIIDNIKIDINDFYYEIINNNILDVNIEIIIDNIIEKPEQKEKTNEKPKELENKKLERKEPIMEQEQIIKQEIKEERCIEEEKEETDIKTIFQNITDDSDEYSTYHIYIVRENDTLETILTKYNKTKDELSEYNNITELKLGDKIIIPEK